MAGAFPDVPGYRFPYDKDGTQVVAYAISGGSIGAVSSSDMIKLNANQNDVAAYVDLRNYTSNTNNVYMTLVFPEVRSISGYYLSVNTSNPTGGRIISTSTDTTTGQDGTWNTVANPYVYANGGSQALAPYYRSGITTVTYNNIKALRFSIANNIYNLHLYGSVPNTGSVDRLRIVDLSGNNIVAQLDYGDIQQRNSSTKQFKVINNSSTLTANNITITLDVNPDANPSLIGQFQLSTDNAAFANTINIGTLAPGASSGTLYVRNSVSSTAQLGPWAARIVASANSWS